MVIKQGSRSLLCMVLFLSFGSALKEITKTGCGTTKGCFSEPVGCDSSSNCDYLVTYFKSGDQIVFELSAKKKWAAIGFNSKGDSMAGTDAVLCTTLSSGIIALQHYDLTSRIFPGKTTPVPTELTLNETSSEGGRTLCKFFRKSAGSGKLKNLNEKVFLVFAYGNVDGDKPKRHDWKITSTSAVDVRADFNVKAGEADLVLLKAHGALMTIAWMGFVAIAIFMARYMKPMWADKTLCGQKVWFVFHRTFMMLGVLFSIIAIILIFVYRKGWSEGIGAHPFTGIITFVLAIINPIMALFRPHPGEPKRFIFNWAHRTVGLSAFVLAVVTLFLAIFLKQLNIEKNALPVMIVFCAGIFIVLLFDIALHLRSRGKESRENIQGTQDGKLEQMQEQQSIANQSDNMIRFAAFVFWTLIAVATTVALVVIINVEIK